MTQYGFFFDQGRCYACQACGVACKDWAGIGPGPEKWMTVYEWETGVFPMTRINTLAFSCGHCENPACIPACPNGAIFKESKYGAVLVDQDTCEGCRKCYDACPYGAPKFASDDEGVKMSKCTMCIDRLEMGEQPQCSASCPFRAFDFGPLEELIAKYGDNRQLDGMPSPEQIRPSFLFKAHLPKRELVPYDAEKVIALNRGRGELDPLFENEHDVKDVDETKVGRNKLVMKHASSYELMRATKNDIG